MGEGRTSGCEEPYKSYLRLKATTASDGAKVMYSRMGENNTSGGDRIRRAVPAIYGDH